MAVSLSQANWTRVLTDTSAKTITPTADIAAVSGAFVVDIYHSISSANKVLTRVRIPVEYSGMQFRVGSQFLLFAGNATTYSAGGTTPANSAATSTSSIVYSPYLDMNAFFTAAGDAT